MTTSWTRLLTHLSILMLMISGTTSKTHSLQVPMSSSQTSILTGVNLSPTFLNQSAISSVGGTGYTHWLRRLIQQPCGRGSVLCETKLYQQRNCKKSFQRALSRKIKDPKQFWSSYNSSKAAYSRFPSSLSDSVSIATTSTSQADMLNATFAINFTKPTIIPAQPEFNESVPVISSVEFSDLDVLHVIRDMRDNVASGPDGISSKLLKGSVPSITSHLAAIFNCSISSGTVPTDWKLSNVCPIFKSGDRGAASNYRLISLLSLPSKVMERLIHIALMQHLLEHNLLSLEQFGFRPSSSTQEAILTATRSWHKTLEERGIVACIFFDLSKAFDTLPHSLIMYRVGVCGELYRWLAGYLTGRSREWSWMVISPKH